MTSYLVILNDLIDGDDLILQIVLMLQIGLVQNASQNFRIDLIRHGRPSSHHLAIGRFQLVHVRGDGDRQLRLAIATRFPLLEENGTLVELLIAQTLQREADT